MPKIRLDRDDMINRFLHIRGLEEEESGIRSPDSMRAIFMDFFDFLADHEQVSDQSGGVLPTKLKSMVERRSLMPLPIETVSALLTECRPIHRLVMDGQEILFERQTELKKMDDGTVLFGSWPQGEHGEREALRWIASVREDKRQLLISEKAVMSRSFDKKEECTWEESDIRRWLNDVFYQHAFSEDEKKRISFSSSGGVFLLSAREAGKFIFSEADRKAEPTALAMKNGAGVNEQGYAFWWLRSAGQFPGSIACVDPDGAVDEGGFHCSSRFVTVRPALWVILQDEEI